MLLVLAPFARGLNEPAPEPRLQFAAGPDLMYADEESVAPAPEFSAGIGYAHLSIGNSESVLSDENALRFEFSASFSPLQKLPQLRLGAAIGTSLVFDDSDMAVVSSGGVVIVGHSTVPQFTVEPEARISWRQPLGNGAWYVEPGFGFGGAIAHLDVNADQTSSNQSVSETGAAFAGRAFVNVGFNTGGGFAGVQLSYLGSGNLDLVDNASGDLDEFYFGLFGSLRF
jgi:hypothetical protein